MSSSDLPALAGAVALALGTLAPLAPSPASTSPWRCRRSASPCSARAGAAVLFGAAPVGSGFRDGIEPALGIDRLSGFFLVTIALTALAALLYARDYLARRTAAPARWPPSAASSSPPSAWS